MTDSRWKNLALEVIGCFVSALGLYSFAVAAGVPVTGVAGIGAILFRLFGLPIGVTNIIMNIPIVLICFKYLGKDFFSAVCGAWCCLPFLRTMCWLRCRCTRGTACWPPSAAV